MNKFTFLIAIIVTILVVPHGSAKATEYRLIRVRNLDFGSYKKHRGAKRTQYDIQVAEDTGDKEIEIIINEAVKDLAKRREVDALAVRLFLGNTRLPYAIAYYAPFGNWEQAESGMPKTTFMTSIKIYPERRPNSNRTVIEDRLPYETRQKIFKEIRAAEKKALSISQQKYPNDIMKQIDYEDTLLNKYKKEIRDKYKISKSQYSKIMVEGVKNNWR